jgi:UDP-glucose 4-epimerase
MKNIIITGADGFVGSYTVKQFLDNSCKVLALDLVDVPRRLFPDENMEYLQCYNDNMAAVFEKIPCDIYDTFIHFAWMGSSGTARIDYNLQMQNALNTVECLKAAKKLGCTRFVCAGSIMEYEVEAVTHSQGSRPGMGYIYGMGKHIAHCMCKAVAANIGIDLLWPMISNAYGIGELSPRFVNTTLRKIINEEPLQFTAATQNYDFVYVSDVAQAIYKVALNGKPFCEYMIGSGDAKTLKEFIFEMVGSCGKESKPLFGDITFTGINMPLSIFSINDIKNDCGFVPEISFAQGAKITMDWLKSLS